MALNVKDGVVFRKLTNEMQLANEAVQGVWAKYQLGTPTITSAYDGEHMTGSLHYEDQAIDYRLNDVPEHLREVLRDEVARLLGPAYTALYEYPKTPRVHLHVQFNRQ